MCWIQMWVTLLVMISVGHLQNRPARAQIAAFDLHLKDLLKLQKGLGWPSVMQVAEGQEALMKLTATLSDQQSCTVTTPQGETFDVSSPPNSRYQQWSDGCGLRVQHVASADEGRWRLTASVGTQDITGWIEVVVREDRSTYSPPPILLQDGKTQAHVELTSLENSYCLVTQPFSESSLVVGHCSVTLDRTTRAVQGNWNVLVGIPGQLSELRVQRQVNVQAERLDVGYVRDTNNNKIHLYCNILHTSKNITFCRFQKTTNNFGFNVMEGLSDGTHSYYGNGFVAKECGMTIEHPTEQEYGTWRCSVGSQMWVGQALVQQTPMQALINVNNERSSRGIREFRVEDEDVGKTEEDRMVFVQEDLSFTMSCQGETSLSYCWFLHPNGTQFSPGPQIDGHPFWYTGHSLQTGDCGITFAHAHASDAGNWSCHMGIAEQMGLEVSERIVVRVTGPLAANRKEIKVTTGINATLHCHTSNGNRPLDYCRFLSPNYVGISIDSSISKENAILGRFYFIPDRSLDYGDCSLVISSVQAEDVGTWTCAARISGDDLESSDTLNLVMFEELDVPRARLTQAGIAGMSIGVLALVSFLLVVVWYQIGKPIPWRTNRAPSMSVDIPFDVMSVNTRSVDTTSCDNRSISSDGSNSSLEYDVNVAGTLQLNAPPKVGASRRSVESGNPS